MKTRAELEKQINTLERDKAVAESRLLTIDAELAGLGIGVEDDIPTLIEQRKESLEETLEALEEKEKLVTDLLEKAETIVND